MYNKLNDHASLISSRICHDLVSPLGAIRNGLELLELTGTPQTPEFELLSQSVEHAVARVDFFRIAYGPNSTSNISSEQINQVLKNYFTNHRCTISWLINEEQSRSVTKLAFLVLQCIESSLPYGGNITVEKSGEVLSILAIGKKIRFEKENWEHILRHSTKNEFGSSEIHFDLALKQAEALNMWFSADHTETNLKVKLQA